jgi:nucleoside 2-deoxyribosyltransferase
MKMEDGKEKYQILNLIFEWVLRQPYKIIGGKTKEWRFFYAPDYITQDDDDPELVNIAEQMKNYPDNIVERVNRALLNLGRRFPEVGQVFDAVVINPLLAKSLFCSTPNQEDEARQILDYLCKLKYLECDSKNLRFSIPFSGWQQIEALTKRLAEINQGFIAMSYQEEAKPILETFRAAIRDKGFVAQIIGEKEHNNQIVPEMFFEIERSKFMVVDVTYANLGAYYEAGYAQALGKQVIVCCRKDAFESNKKSERPHFDIAQKSMIVWETDEELKKKLMRRIEATVK